jgi:phosphonate transport system substrate-binding protein
MEASPFVMGAVAYDPKVVTIWEGFRRHLRDRHFDFDFVLYSNYERQVDDLVDGTITAAWNSPLAWIRTTRLAATRGVEPAAIAMRDSDRDLTSVIVVRCDSNIGDVGELRGRAVGTGALDSPQATLLPLSHLRGLDLLPGRDFSVRRFDVGVGLHGDHVGGERAAAQALVGGEVDAACMIDGNHLVFVNEGTLPAGSTTVLAQTGRYDHCNMSVLARAAPDAARFADVLRDMAYEDPQVRPLLDLEGLKEWLPGRTTGYALLERAVDESGFYDRAGAWSDAGYRP